MILRSLLITILLVAEVAVANPAFFTRPVRATAAGGGGGGYVAVANDFDGTDDSAERDGDLDGNADSKKIIGSFWVKFDATNQVVDTQPMALFNTQGDRVQVEKRPEGYFRVRLLNATGTTILQLEQDTAKVARVAVGSWYNVLFACDLAVAGTRYLYVNNVEALNTGTITFTDDTVDFTVADHCIMGAVGGGFHVNGCESEIWIGYGQSIDLSNSSNRAKWVSGTGGSAVPVDLGAAGATPTGTSPIIYFKGDYNGVSTGGAIANTGTGGNFVKKGVGALTACSNHP